MAGKALSAVRVKETFFILATLVFVYQRLHNNFGKEPAVNATEEDPCMVSEGTTDESQQCTERKLFQSWKQAAEEEEDSLGTNILRKSSPQQGLRNATSEAVSKHVVNEWLTEVAALLHESTSQSESEIQAKLDHLFTQTLKANATSSNSTQWAQNLQALQARMQAQQLHLPSHHTKQSQAEHANFMDLFNRTADAIHKGSSSHWAQDLQKTKDLLETRLKALKQKHSHSHTLRGKDHASSHPNSTMSVIIDLHAHLQAVYENLPSAQQVNLSGSHHNIDAPDTTMTPFARELMQDQKKLESKMGALRESHHKHARTTSSKEKPLMERIVDFGQKMCQHASRRSRPECAEFLHAAGTSHSEEVDAEKALSHREWDDKMASEIMSLTQELCEDPSRRHHSSCRRFHASAAEQDATKLVPPKSGLRGTKSASQYLDWSSVQSWKARARNEKTGPKVLTRAQLRHGKWQGKLPKVACITAISSGHEATARIRYVIDNFNLQSYEGDRQLIIVYHHQDSEARHLVRAVADGEHIKGVAARTQGKVPSTVALRFGAWTANADVIARWDFNDYHHPQRLSMQIRALAMSSRPASLLTTAAAELNMDVGSAHEHGFLVGETRWMHEHWYPLMEEEKAVLKGAEAFHIVAVDMPELNMHKGDAK